MAEDFRYYDILLPVPTVGVYTYSSTGRHSRGERVVVPFGRRQMTGIILKNVQKPEFECKDILMSYDEEPLFSDTYLDFIMRLAEYYAVQPGLALHGILSDKLLNLESAEKFIKKYVKEESIELTNQQQKILDAIDIDDFSRHLIYGVTGSGKTEVYLEVAKKVIAKGRQVLYIVPEISLTPQLIDRVSARFGYQPLIFHSKLSIKARQTAFLSFANNEADFMIGARSALFVPAKQLGLIIIDEEHEPGYKQEDSPPYQLRDMAVMYASLLKIPVVMGSATPSIESVYNTENGKYTLHRMTDRPEGASMPELTVIDIKQYDMIDGTISEPLFDKLSETVSKGEQAIIFLNRKGYSTSLYCKRCGEPATCLNCSVGLVYYKAKNICSCRYCNTDYRELECIHCGGKEFREFGAGTERVAEFLDTMFPSNVIRIDTDNSSTVNKLSAHLKAFERKEAQILVGTQLVAKGLHFPNVTFVGILGIDSLLSMPDFRATERAYQLLVQVAGRAGREALKGTVYLQTMNPESPIFKFINGDEESFYEYELQRRNMAGYPPYSKMARLILTHSDSAKCWTAARDIAKIIRDKCPNVSLLGPAEAEINKVKNRYRLSILLKSATHNPITKAIAMAENRFDAIKQGSMQLKTDKDPYFMM